VGHRHPATASDTDDSAGHDVSPGGAQPEPGFGGGEHPQRFPAGWRPFSVILALATVTALAGINVLARPLVIAGMLAVGPCLAAISASPTAVVAVGGYTLALLALLSSWPDHLWGSAQQLLYALIILAVTGVSVIAARRRQRLEWLAQQGGANLRLLSAIVESSDDAIIGKTLDGTITSWNGGAERMYGYTAAEAIGRNIAIIACPAEVAELSGILARLAGGERVEHYETQRIRKDGSVVDVSVTISPIRDDSGRVVAASAVAHDITARKLAEARERAMQERSNQAQRLQSLGQLAGGIAHDFNNLLAVISNYATFAAEETTDHPGVQADLARIRTAAERAGRLTRQLLVFARGEPQQAEVFDLNGAIADARSLLARTIGEHIELITVPSPEPLMISADRGQVQQILLNLALNARDAMPEGGTLVIEAAPVIFDDQQIDVQPKPRPGRYARLLVSDTGVGMSPEVAARIFEPFYTTKPKGQGTGLGLATVYGVVTQAGGSIKVYSEPSLGTTIRVYLPTAEQPAVPGPVPTEEEPPEGHGERILLVEDEDEVRRLVVRILERHGYQVLTARTGPEALKLAGDDGCDMLLTDVVMPEMSGPHLAGLMRRDRPDLPVLYMSGYSDGQLTAQRIVDEAVELIQKPFTPRELLHRVHGVVARSASTRQPRGAQPEPVSGGGEHPAPLPGRGGRRPTGP
jgi:two-component system cell cycle sensor histidine kinase/response regulator CckA